MSISEKNIHNRKEIIAFNNSDNEITLIGTSHNKKEELQLIYKAVKQGFQNIQSWEY